MGKIAAALSLFYISCISLQAGNIIITISGELDTGGADAAGLDGATLSFVTTIDDTVAYSQVLGGNENTNIPQVVGTPFVSISGSSIPGNNGNFNVADPVAWFPRLSSVQNVDTGDFNISVTIASGTFTIGFDTVATADGLTIVQGDFPEAADFGPTTATFLNPALNPFISIAGSSYTLQNGTVTAIPEPGLLVSAAGLAALGAMLVRRKRLA